jgi:hypothetical protein
MSSDVVVAFDIGVKNLAYCIFNKGSKQIVAWENVNLFDVMTSASAATAPTSEPNSCKKAGCKSKPSWVVKGSATYCLRHIPAGFSPLKNGDGTVLKKIPALTVLKEIAGSAGSTCKKKDDYIAHLMEKYAMPIKAPKKEKVKDTGLDYIHDAIRKMIYARADVFKICNIILLENQPVFKNPTMKSVQMILFTALREFFYTHQLQIPFINFIHAGKKVKGATKGDAGYAERKDGSEARVKKWLDESGPVSLSAKQIFTDAKKKSDLADALCMCLDYV